MKQSLQNLAIRFLVAVVKRLPLKAVRVFGRAVGHVMWRAETRGARVTRWNMRMCFPEKTTQEQDQLAYESVLETAITGIELFWVWVQPAEKVFARVVDIKGLEAYQAAIDAKQGVLLAAPHLGNWETLGLYLAQQAPITCMYAPIKIDELNTLVKTSRAKTGASLVPTDLSGVRSLLKALKKGEQVGILPDQRAQKGSGVFSPFFGKQAYTVTLVTALQKKAKEAKVFIAYAERVEKGWVFHFQPAPEAIYSEDEQTSVDALNAGVEAAVRQIPTQYQWEYKRFGMQPDGANPYEPIKHGWPKDA